MSSAPAPGTPERSLSSAVDTAGGTVIVTIKERHPEGDVAAREISIALTPPQSRELRHRIEQAERVIEDVGDEPGLKG